MAALLRKMFIRARSYSSSFAKELAIEKIRNVGIMAHIDAGKTTTTERMLYYAGHISRMGDIDNGNTTMDYLKQERERGITINAAAITFPWKQHQINLIDTPGHIDFTFEVERSLRVLDGGIVLLDASAGVEAQTSSVWRQANRYDVPRIVFINKMDKSAASFNSSINSMKQKLKVNPLITQLPVGQGKVFSGVVDLVAMELLLWKPDSNDGSDYLRCPLECEVRSREERDQYDERAMFIRNNLELKLPVVFLEEVYDARLQLVEQLAMVDNSILDKVLCDTYHPLKLDKQVLKTSIRNMTLQCQAVAVLCGSSLKNKCIQLLMDAVISYLPSPAEKSIIIPEALRDLVAFAFKVTHDPKRGPLVYLKIYSGSLKPQSTIYNLTQRKRERITRVIHMLADEQKEVQLMTQGNIAVAVGLKHTVTGDTLINSASSADELGGPDSSLILQGPKVPEPMFFCTIEPNSAAYQKDLDNALSCLSREDPSLFVSVDEDTGQTILSGMGELHLEIILDRIRREYKVEANLGKLQVAYREAPTQSINISDHLNSSLGNQTHSVSVSLTLEPSESVGRKPEVTLPNMKEMTFPSSISQEEIMAAVCSGVQMATLRGPILAFPVCRVQVLVNSLTIGPGTSVSMVTNCIANCLNEALSKAEVVLLEPYVELEVTVSEDHLHIVLGDLTSGRRGQIKSVEDHMELKTISAVVPVASLAGYSTSLRTLTSGMASFASQFSHYEPVNKQLERNIIQDIRGY